MTLLWTRRDAGYLVTPMVASTATTRPADNQTAPTEPSPGNRVVAVCSQPLIPSSLLLQPHPRYSEQSEHPASSPSRGSSPTTAARPLLATISTAVRRPVRKRLWRTFLQMRPSISTLRHPRVQTGFIASPQLTP